MDKEDKPKLTIITPSYNQAAYIGQTIESVRTQDYPDVEHIIVDGGSSDDTVEILGRYEHLIWISEKDRGQADALNKGLALATGDIIGWINSDDYYEKDAFKTVADCFSDPSTMWIVGNLNYVDDHGSHTVPDKSPEVTYGRLLRNPDIVRQPPTFFRRSFLDRAGGWNAEFFMVMDFDLWVRLAKLSPPSMVDKNLAYFRLHSEQKSCFGNLQRQTRELRSILEREGASWGIVTRLCLKKEWYAFKGYCKMLLAFLHLLGIVQRRRFANRPSR
jgi:glycosyltransferase involved in cell wall biosynthesis